MLIPQFSIRWLLGLTTVCAVAFSVVGLAIRGHYWAIGVSAAIGALVVTMSIYAVLFAVLWLFSLVSGRQRRGQSPFQSGGGATPLTPLPDKEIPAQPILLE